MSFPSPNTPCIELLTELSVTFRDPEARHAYVSRHPDFSTWLHTVVQRTIQEAALEQRIAVCKLVANFVADDDANRGIICEQTPFLRLLDLVLQETTVSEELQYDLVKPCLASVLNLVLSSEYTTPRTHLLHTGSWASLVRLANRIYRPAEPHTADLDLDRITRATVASWAWKSLLAILETDSESFAIPLHAPADLCAPLEHFSRPHPSPGPDPQTMEEDLEILHSATTAIGLLCTSPAGVGAFVQLLRSETEAARWVVGFVEDGDVVPGWDEVEDSDTEEDEDHDQDQIVPSAESGLRKGEKELGKAKASLMSSLAELCAAEELQLFPDDSNWFCDTLMRWITSEREDLVDCALMCLGNYVNSDEKAVQIASQAELITRLLGLLDSSNAETPAQEIHALIGLLRNLSLAPGIEIKRTLATPVVRALGRMQVLDPAKDLVASVQAGAVGLLRLLSRGDERTARIVQDEQGLTRQMMNLWARTDSQPLKIEVSRLVTTLVRALSSQEALVVRNEKEIAALTMLVGLGAAQEVVFAEGVLALALITKSATGASAVRRVLGTAEDTALSGLKTYASTATAPPSILSNVCVLLLNLANGREGDGQGQVDTAGEGRVKGYVREVLEIVAGREGLDDTLRVVVKSAQEAWR